ncbi:hypothetical protein ACFSTC_10755 [Nonomuraea ferruginea]
MPLLVGLSAVAGLRRVVVSPLGVARRQTPPGMRALRVLALLVVLAAFPLLGLEASVTVIAVAIALALLSLNLAGPWVVGLIGRVAAAFARTPALLLAGRRLVDDPRSAWRTVSGVALTGFVAGFLGMLSPGAFSSGASHAEFRLAVVEGRPAVVAEQAREQMRDAGLAARVEHSEKLVTVTVTGDAAPAAGDAAAGDAGKGDAVAGDGGGVGVVVVDRARTALAGLVPGRTPTSEADDQRFGFQLLDDVRVGTVVVLSVSFLVAIASAGITAASSVLDRRQTYGLLRLARHPADRAGPGTAGRDADPAHRDGRRHDRGRGVLRDAVHAGRPEPERGGHAGDLRGAGLRGRARGRGAEQAAAGGGHHRPVTPPRLTGQEGPRPRCARGYSSIGSGQSSACSIRSSAACARATRRSGSAM